MIPWFRRLKWWKYFCGYFPISLIKTADLDPKKNYVFGYHPHGIIGLGAIGNFGSEATGFSEIFPGIVPHLLTLAMNFRFPFMRDIIMSSGVCSVDRESIEHILQKMGPGHSVVIVVGGAAESLDAHPDSLKLTLKDRKGFVKLALRNGASLVPVFSFGENSLYEQVSNPRGSALREWQTKMKNVMGFAPPIFHGRGVLQYTFGLIPYRRPVYSVVGEPIHVTKIKEPSVEEVDSFHQKYIDGLISIFEKHKSKYGIPEDKHLEIC